MNDDRTARLERLSAYLAGDLDPDEAEALAAELESDPALRAELESLEHTQALLADLPAEEPSAPFSRRLRDVASAAAREGPVHDDLEQRREQRADGRWSALRPLGIAAAAAAVIAVVGVGAGVVLRGGLGGGADTATEGAAGVEADEEGYVPTVPVIESENDYGDLELQRLAVNTDTQFIVPPDLGVDGARELEAELVPQITGGRVSDVDALSARQAQEEDAPTTDDAQQESANGGDAAQPRPASSPDQGRVGGTEDPRDVAARCLPEILEETDTPLVPVYVELATYEDIPAILLTFASLNPTSGSYDRVEVWAMARSDCHTLQFAQYTRSGS